MYIDCNKIMFNNYINYITIDIYLFGNTENKITHLIIDIASLSRI